VRRVLPIVLVVLAGVAGWLAYALYTPYQGFLKEGVFVEVPRGATTRSIARLLEENGVIHSRWTFELLARWRSRQPLQAGEYHFDRPHNVFEVFRWVADGHIYFRTLTIPEGFNMFQIAALLEEEGFLTREEFLSAARTPEAIRDLAPNANTLEGYLFPASYQLPRHPAAKEVVAAMVSRFREAWASLPESDRVGRNVEQVVTLASLVEKETGQSNERALVSAVFTNRLKRGIALQCDPTVIYALGLAGRYNGNLLLRDLRFDSPYNTYRYPGLPPGPIANPGERSLRAALAPAPVEYLYFVASGDGGHLFSRTLREHNRSVALFRQKQAEERTAADPPPPSAPKPQAVSPPATKKAAVKKTR